MTNSSAPSASRMRAKPLRTYGKRSTTRENSPREPSPKKRRLSTEETSLKTNTKIDNTESPSLPDIASTGSKDSTTSTATESKSAKDVVKKGSILNFFKPVSWSSSTVAPSPKSEEPQPESTPPSSPPQPPRIEPRRKPRILRFRGTSLPILDKEESEANTQDEENAEEGRSPLKERQGGLSNQHTKPKRPTPKPQTVQTTLNISSQAPFSECKVCNTVWNPLYPDDVKYHTKQHSAVLRKKKKLRESEIIE